MRPLSVYVPDDEEGGANLAYGRRWKVPNVDEAMPKLALSGFTGRQEYRIVMIGEKSSLREVLLPIAKKIGAELALPTGEASNSMLAGIADRANDDGRRCVILYFSDFDPSGRHMVTSVSRKFQALVDLLHPDLEIEVHAVCLTHKQVAELNLPSTPLKDGELRAPKWRERFQHEQTEIDALATLFPDKLEEIALRAIAPFYDWTLDARVKEARVDWEREARLNLMAHPEYTDVAAVVQSAIDDARRANEALAAWQQEAFNLLGDVEVPEIDLPEPELTEPMPEPLFSTDLDYFEATTLLIERRELAGDG